MKRWILPADVTDAAKLVLEEAPVPMPGPGEVRIRVRAISMNYRDQLILKGPFGRLPGRDLVPLSDFAGEIDAVGPQVERWRVGDRVTNLHMPYWSDGRPPAAMGLGLGALEEDGVLAEYVVLPAGHVMRAPANLGHAEAATLPVAALTAWNALFGDHPVAADSSVLIIGSGGVSLFGLQLARAAGARVYATVREDAKGDALVRLGVDGFVNSMTEPQWGQAVFELSGGVDKVVDSVGTSILPQALAALAPGGEVATLGLFDVAGEPLDAYALLGKQARVRGVAVGSRAMHHDLVSFVETHDIHPVIDRRIDFLDAPTAYTAQTSAGLFGKVVIELS
ncbi:NAD(P)-dependent alcohol dehydrogenase [Streptomyces caniscabiei]|uniref:zinc-dependent alcohol dehydrogenase family protein n=1 Tax=Streptomyces caniscabiei TaxID=2746961 RepID=UPI0029A9A6B3|nr:NAD(P)-dependent alcohol dehydrogenase [Streptomyces caniscabiei]MDX2604270.1 NAD(P)-dependent alcohol dehydrogenase [Streptomyces caniscabiei]MDX2735612.1 NAD(P)-dependent alcohol dehydrogenase [Streptomyces caniscabiei]MDX2781912.1 NAD(P)-dependent alcohol dehydrogenase [Streptomyces caniscabiei]